MLPRNVNNVAVVVVTAAGLTTIVVQTARLVGFTDDTEGAILFKIENVNIAPGHLLK